MLFNKNITLYFQLYLHLRDQIILGDLQPETKLPNTDELSRIYDVSQSTVLKAMELLEKEGLIFRKQKIGTIVTENAHIFISHPSSSLEEIRKMLRSTIIKPISEEWVKAPKRIQAIFSDQKDLLRDGKIFHLKRLVTVVEDPRRKALFNAYVPAFVMDKISMEILRYRSINEVALGLKDYQAVRVIQTIRTRICDIDTGKYLGLEAGTPMFHQTWVFEDKEGRTLICSELLTNANAFVRTIDFE
jgi:GntR family transcriptional regulator